MVARVFDAHACPPAKGALTHQPIRDHGFIGVGREFIVFKDNSQPELSFYCKVNHYSHFGSALRISEKKTLPRIRRRLYR